MKEWFLLIGGGLLAGAGFFLVGGWITALGMAGIVLFTTFSLRWRGTPMLTFAGSIVAGAYLTDYMGWSL